MSKIYYSNDEKLNFILPNFKTSFFTYNIEPLSEHKTYIFKKYIQTKFSLEIKSQEEYMI